MEKKCPKCKRWFDTGEFAEEYCPYCGQVLSEADREKIRRKDYFLDASCHQFWLQLY